MRRRSKIKVFHSIGTFMPASFLALILAILVPTLTYSADKLIVED